MLKNILKKIRSNKSSQSGVGGQGEDFAAQSLRRKGYKIIERNWYNTKGRRLGEIDIIAKDDETIVFVEVKSRSVGLRDDPSTILPQENITAAKLHKLARIAEVYISQNQLWDAPWRIDAFSVVYRHNKEPKVEHIEGIFL